MGLGWSPYTQKFPGLSSSWSLLQLQPTSFQVLSSGSGDSSLSRPCDLLFHSVPSFHMLSLLVAAEEPGCGQIPIFLGRCAFYSRSCCPLPRPLHPIMSLRLWPFLSQDAVFSTLTCLSPSLLLTQPCLTLEGNDRSRGLHVFVWTAPSNFVGNVFDL